VETTEYQPLRNQCSISPVTSGEEIRMLHVVTSENSGLYANELEQSYRLRHKVFVNERKWTDLARPDEREIDQFDDASAIYLLALEGDKDRKVVGGCRLVPTTGPYLLPDVFPALSQQPVPRGPNVFEWGRLYVTPARRDGPGGRRHALSRTTCIIVAGMVEYCLEEGIDQLAVVSEMFFLPLFLELGLQPKPLGLPDDIEGVPTIAYTLVPSDEALAKIRDVHGFEAPVLAKSGITRPAVRPVLRHMGARPAI
jgi:acyl-homoserine lactone synthase